ncbi:MAG: N-acetylmuramic acid 6-phosphate etherase [Oscillospiraceae bacterium]|nr:N-acetylmuramic acid 6-phosphate etherase [Oscillospiraceae bacterium]
MNLDLYRLVTENRNPDTMELDKMTPLEIVTAMNREDAKVPTAIATVLPQIAMTVEWAIEAVNSGGRLIYIGAGTSGRLGVLDAAECPPTFGVSPDVVVGLIAGGEKAFIKAVEGAEDSFELGAENLRQIKLTERDVVVGIAASGRTPYVLGGLDYAKKTGCHTAAIACNVGSDVGAAAEIAIEAVVGPEVLTGSTRLKAGTAQKLILNMISTATMVGVGKVYKNLMVDVMQTNEKLRLRAEKIVAEAAETDRSEAAGLLREAGGDVKAAIVMSLLNCSADTAKKRLASAKGHVRRATEK